MPGVSRRFPFPGVPVPLYPEVLFERMAQVVAVEVRIDLGGEDAFMPRASPVPARMLAPPSSRCVANECRNVCGLMCLSMPARWAACFRIVKTSRA